MRTLRAAVSRLLATGLLSKGWYSILTGLALIFLALQLGTVGWDVDPAANVVALAFLVLGSWHLGRGVRAERGRRAAADDAA